MTREELLRSPEYWIAGLQLDLFNEIQRYMIRNNKTQDDLSSDLNIPKYVVNQLMAADYNQKFEKFIQLCLSIGKVPVLMFKDIEVVIQQDLIPPQPPSQNNEHKQ